jgi:predicted RNase H-like HicB family nuclease
MKVSVDFYIQAMMCNARIIKTDEVWEAFVPAIPEIYFTTSNSYAWAEVRLEDMIYDWVQKALENDIPTPTLTLELGDYE